MEVIRILGIGNAWEDLRILTVRGLDRFVTAKNGSKVTVKTFTLTLNSFRSHFHEYISYIRLYIYLFMKTTDLHRQCYFSCSTPHKVEECFSFFRSDSGGH